MLLPKISIIVPAYNEEKFLPGCLRSIRELDYPAEKLEVIVIDNGSTDTTRDIARRHAAIILENGTMNVSGLRNLGAQEATGEILAFVDADCSVTVGWLKAAVKYFEDQSIAAWGAPANIPSNATWVQSTWYIIRKNNHIINDADWLESMNLFTRRQSFLEVDGFDETLVTCEDVDLCYRLKHLGRIVSDSNIQIIHHGEADTFVNFFRKEVWRGMGNLYGVFRHGLSFKELPSLLLPLHFLLLLPLSAILIVSLGAVTGTIIVVFFLLFPAIMVIIKKRAWRESPMTIMRLICLLEVYFFARTVALFKKSRKRQP